ncbi:MAG: homoserine kinase [Ancrocorticia sp.]|jgi:homoserine kinase|nr:homoserine kinase [Ancrocorticia sp.]MCI2002553.1 homoserine kinase [Ancrocorticia sp.]MCI2012618.1 homoserine kinase [Ancrocorticia sp.]MCI2029251.1 homoserine kinase [Ancrocorticia sp.]MCI2177935.1 homoserine kinase [Ancrocorticia sp.]
MGFARDTARVRVPATSGNLGPGFDCMGMAHSVWDEVSVRLTTGKTRVRIFGEGQGNLPDDDSHLVVRALRRGLDVAGLPQSGIELTCRNGIPQGRGLGSSAAAVVAGLMLVRGLMRDPELFDDAAMLRVATEFEGHPDNAAPAIYGGAVVAWMEKGVPQAVPLRVSPDVTATLLVPDAELLTETARAVLPAEVPHADAAFNASRAALLVVALEHRPDLLWQATQDKLHQDYRADAMQASADALRWLRGAGWPTVVSGAGPSLLVFGTLDPETSRIMESRGFHVVLSSIGRGAHLVQ